MPTWVRYSVTAYVGLLLAGSIASSGVSAPPNEPMASVYDRYAPDPVPVEKYYLVPVAPSDPDPSQAES